MVIHVALYYTYNNCALDSVAESSVSVGGMVGGGVGFVVLLAVVVVVVVVVAVMLKRRRNYQGHDMAIHAIVALLGSPSYH